jgi:hypothetical protein
MKNNTLAAFEEWDSITDYESDERSVILYRGSIKVAEFNYPNFTREDFIYFKDKFKEQNKNHGELN